MSLTSLVRAYWDAKRPVPMAEAVMTRLQEQRFRALLRYTVQQSPFYRRYYREHGITERHLDEVRLRDLPPSD